MKAIPAEIVLHNQVQTLNQLFNMLVTALNPIVVVNHGQASEVLPNGLSVAARAAVEVALIDVGQRISNLMTDSERWKIDNVRSMEHILAEEEAEVAEAMMQAMLSNKGSKRKKGNDSNEQQ